MKSKLLACHVALGLGVLYGVARAEEVSSEVLPTVAVAGLKAPELRPYQTMLRGAHTYEKLKAMAPDAPFFLMIKPRRAGLDIRTVTLKIVGEQTTVAVPVAEDGTFNLPILGDPEFAHAEMVVNQKKSDNAIGWRPRIVTPGLPPNTRRLGDLRLECEIQWAIDKSDMSFMARSAFALLGGPCNTSKVQMQFEAPAQLAGATLRNAERTQTIRLTHGGSGFIAPVHDKSWPDDALIEFQPAE